MTPRQQRSSYTPEFRNQAARLVIESSLPAAEVAREIGVREQTLSTWVSRYGQEHSTDPTPLSDSERTRLTAAEKEVRDLRLELEFLKKSRSVLREGSPVSAKYACIDDTETAHPRRFGIKRMCAWLGVSPSGFFTWRRRPPPATAARRSELAEYVRWSFTRSNGTYGHRRVHADLAARGVAIGLDLVRHLMAQADLVACQPRPFRQPGATTTGSSAGGCHRVATSTVAGAAAPAASSGVLLARWRAGALTRVPR